MLYLACKEQLLGNNWKPKSIGLTFKTNCHLPAPLPARFHISRRNDRWVCHLLRFSIAGGDSGPPCMCVCAPRMRVLGHLALNIVLHRSYQQVVVLMQIARLQKLDKTLKRSFLLGCETILFLKLVLFQLFERYLWLSEWPLILYTLHSFANEVATREGFLVCLEQEKQRYRFSRESMRTVIPRNLLSLWLIHILLSHSSNSMQVGLLCFVHLWLSSLRDTSSSPK